MDPKMTVGDRIRQARTARHLSLNDVATRAAISVATLSRIERDKQGLDLVLFLLLARILKTPPRDLIGEETGANFDSLATRIASLNHNDRLQLWRDLAAHRRNDRSALHRRIARAGEEVDELLAQLEYVRAEVESVRLGVRKR